MDGMDPAGWDTLPRQPRARAARTPDVTALLRDCLAAIKLPPDAASLYRVPAPPDWS